MVFNMQSNETSNMNKKLHIQKCLSLAHADTALVSGVSERLKVTKEPEAQILKHNLEIPPQAEVISVALSCLPPIMQQLIPTRIKHVSGLREATEIPTVIYIWPVLWIEEACKPFWDRLSNSLIPNSPNLARHCSSPDEVTEDVACSQVTPVKQIAQEQGSKTTKSYPLILKSSNTAVSRILKSLSNTKNKDYESILPLSSTSPIGKRLKIPFKENAMIIHNREVYIHYAMRHKTLSPDKEISNQDMLHRKITVTCITCRTIREITTRSSHPLLSSQCVAKQNIRSLTTLAAQDETSSTAHFSSPRMATMFQHKQCSSLTRKGQQAFLKKAAFPSKELQNTDETEAQQKVDKELRKKFGIVKDIRIHVMRINPGELQEDFGKDCTLKWKFPRKDAFPSEKLKRFERVSQQKEDNELRRKFGIVKDVRTHLKRLKF